MTTEQKWMAFVLLAILVGLPIVSQFFAWLKDKKK